MADVERSFTIIEGSFLNLSFPTDSEVVSFSYWAESRDGTAVAGEDYLTFSQSGSGAGGDTVTAQFFSPAEIIMIDLDDNRLEVAKRFGATTGINSADGKAVEAVMKLTGGRGVDAAIEAVGIPATFELCEQLIAPGGAIANIGVHGKKVDLHLESLWDRNIAITTRLVDTATIPMLFKTVRSHKIDPKLLITHRFKLDEIEGAYELFAHQRDGVLKVAITP